MGNNYNYGIKVKIVTVYNNNVYNNNNTTIALYSTDHRMMKYKGTPMKYSEASILH